jgi:hypothetical protein
VQAAGDAVLIGLPKLSRCRIPRSVNVKERRPDGSWRDPGAGGAWRYASGEFIPIVPNPMPRGPARTPEHEMSVRLADDIVARSTPRQDDR